MLTHERLKELLSYDPKTGVLTWRVRRGGKANAGTPFGWIENNGYRRGFLDRKRYLAHDLIWLYVTGRWPKHEIDHRDRDMNNNRIENLRDVTHSHNALNAKTRYDSKTGVKGVHQRKDGRYRAGCRIDGRQINCGTFGTLDEAKRARVAFMSERFGEFFREE